MAQPDKDSSLQPPPVDPVRLQYFSANAPDALNTRVALPTIFLILGWLPYTCGIVGALTVAHSYSRPIIEAHSYSAAAFMAVGACFSLLSFLIFICRRSTAGAIAAAAVVMVQLSLAVCAGLAER